MAPYGRELTPPDEPWRIRVNLAPLQVFPGAFAALWLYHTWCKGRPFCTWAELQSRISDADFLTRTFFYLNAVPSGLTGPHVELPHMLFLRSIPKKRLLVGYIEVFGLLRLGGILASNYRQQTRRLYVADPMAVTDLSDRFILDDQAFYAMDWEKIPTAGRQFRHEVTPSLEASLAVLKRVWEQRENDLVKTIGNAQGTT